MAQDVNVVTLVGRLTRDPELRTTNGGTSLASLRLASNGSRKNSAGGYDETVGYFDVTVFGKTAENAAKYLTKGSRVIANGRLSWREWEDKDGNKRQAVEVAAHSLQFLDTKEQAQGQSSARTESAPPPNDDDIPF